MESLQASGRRTQSVLRFQIIDRQLPNLICFSISRSSLTVFRFIAGTYTPLCLLAFDEAMGRRLLLQVWLGAGAGIIHSVFSKGGTGSKVLSAALYIALGWIALPYSQQMKAALGPGATGLVVAGGVIYSLGAVIYAAHWPDPYPEVFGYRKYDISIKHPV